MNQQSVQNLPTPVADSAKAEVLRLEAANNRLQGEIDARLDVKQPWKVERILIRALIDRSPDYLFCKDTQSRFIIANQALATDTGKARPEDLVGLTDFDIHPAEWAQEFFDVEQNMVSTGQPMIDMEELVLDAHGRKKWLMSTKLPLRNDRNEIIGIVGIARNITGRKMAELLRAEEGRILEMIVAGCALDDVLNNLIQVIEAQLEGIVGSILLLDEAREHLHHCAAPNLPEIYTKLIDGIAIGPNVGSCGTAAWRREPVIVADIQQDPLWQDFRGVIAPFGLRSCWSAPILSHQGGVLGTFAMYSREVRTPEEIETRLVAMATRIAGIAIQRKQAEERIHHMAHHDALTGLPNRTLLMDRLAQAILYAQRYNRVVTVVFVDLDNFKLVNDSLGHSAGDELLKIAADRMVQSVRATDTVARLGGDEFVLLLDQMEDPGDLAGKIRSLQAKLAEPVTIDGHDLQVTSSMGLAMFPDDGTDVKTLLMNADAAMYRAKEKGRDNFQFFTAALSVKNQGKLSILEGLRNAVARDELILYYQPLVDARTGAVFAVEALVRWQHAELGLVPPVNFISLAEETGLIVPIGDWVLRTACRQNKAWQDAGLPPVRVGVNVSAKQFTDATLIERVAQALRDSGLEAKYLDLELTESLVMQDVRQAVAKMQQLTATGVTLSIDDFGTGYSSLHALKKFPAGRLKLDRSFVRDIPHNKADNAIAIAVITMGHQLNVKVIAEGVETAEQLEFLREHDCDEYQGYYFSRPLTAEGMEAFLYARNDSAAATRL